MQNYKGVKKVRAQGRILRIYLVKGHVGLEGNKAAELIGKMAITWKENWRGASREKYREEVDRARSKVCVSEGFEECRGKCCWCVESLSFQSLLLRIKTHKDCSHLGPFSEIPSRVTDQCLQNCDNCWFWKHNNKSRLVQWSCCWMLYGQWLSVDQWSIGRV